jgi:putative N6-adenine-specific DNA methylase
VDHTTFAVSAPGLEPLLLAELTRLGVADAVAETGGVAFAASPRSLATVLMGSRVASRVIVRVASFRTTAFAHLYKQAAAVPWAQWIAPKRRIRLRVTCKKSRLYHSDAVAERVGQAVMASVRGVTVVEGAGDDDAADDAQLIVVRVAQDVCTISVDAAGEALHRRGWRQAVAKAPLRETLAAAMLAGAGWDGRSALVDPLCGSGTLIIEGALLARRMQPGRARRFAAEQWPGSDAALWRAVRADAASRELPAADIALIGTDRDSGAIEAARANAERAGVAADTEFFAHALSDAEAPEGVGLLVANPPYGIRIGEEAAVRDLYARFGQVARARFGGWRVAFLSADRTPGHALERQLRLPLTPVWRTSNGGIPVRLLVGTVPR